MVIVAGRAIQVVVARRIVDLRFVITNRRRRHRQRRRNNPVF
jgi:hypothetical protein